MEPRLYTATAGATGTYVGAENVTSRVRWLTATLRQRLRKKLTPATLTLVNMEGSVSLPVASAILFECRRKRVTSHVFAETTHLVAASNGFARMVTTAT